VNRDQTVRPLKRSRRRRAETERTAAAGDEQHPVLDGWRLRRLEWMNAIRQADRRDTREPFARIRDRHRLCVSHVVLHHAHGDLVPVGRRSDFVPLLPEPDHEEQVLVEEIAEERRPQTGRDGQSRSVGGA
jgi:hypothetical protein